MGNEPTTQRLSDNEYVTVVVRILIDQTGAIRQGTVVDLYERPIGQFRRSCELAKLLVAWLRQHASDHSDANS